VFFSTGCYQPAGPLIPMSAGWDPQKVGQPALQQLALASPGIVQPVTCQTTIASSSAPVTSHTPSHQLCEDVTLATASSRPAAESAVARPHKTVMPGSVEVGVGTHSADRKSGRNRSFHSSLRPSSKSRNPTASVPVGAAHLVVADQERELDLSQKGTNAYSSAGSVATVVTTHESIIRPAIGVVHDVSHATVSSFSSGVSQIGHLERFVRGLVTSDSESSELPAPEVSVAAAATTGPTTASRSEDSGTAFPKRKPEETEVSADENQSVSPKKVKYSTEDGKCLSEVQRSSNDEVQSSCASTEDQVVVMGSQQSSGEITADVSVKPYTDLDKNEGALSLPDVACATEPPTEDQPSQYAEAEMANSPVEFAVSRGPESSESCELASADTSSDTATSCVPTICVNSCPASPAKEVVDIEQVGNPKNKDSLGGNPKKCASAGMAESKQRTSPVRSKSASELSRKKLSISVQEKLLENAGAAQTEKLGRKSDEGPTRSASARRKRDTGGWEWHGEPERKPVYYKVIFFWQ